MFYDFLSPESTDVTIKKSHITPVVMTQMESPAGRIVDLGELIFIGHVPAISEKHPASGIFHQLGIETIDVIDNVPGRMGIIEGINQHKAIGSQIPGVAGIAHIQSAVDARAADRVGGFGEISGSDQNTRPIKTQIIRLRPFATARITDQNTIIRYLTRNSIYAPTGYSNCNWVKK